MTTSQKDSFLELWPKYGIAQTSLHDVFTSINNPLTIEIGFGDGRSLLEMAIANPDKNFVGIEVFQTGIAKLLRGIESHALTNLKICQGDAVEILRNQVRDGECAQIQLYFPDPWPKKRHHKRRIIQKAFVELVASKLQSKGCLHLATDWAPYAAHMLEVVEACGCFVNQHGAGCFAPRPQTRPLTKFEQRGQRLGYDIYDLLYCKVN